MESGLASSLRRAVSGPCRAGIGPVSAALTAFPRGSHNREMRRLRVLGPLEVDGAARSSGLATGSSSRPWPAAGGTRRRRGDRGGAVGRGAPGLGGQGRPRVREPAPQGAGQRRDRDRCGRLRVRTDHLDIDRQQFEDLVTRAREHLVTRTPERAITMLTDALALWRGPAFGELEDWMPGQLEAVRLGQLRLSAEEDLLQARLDAGDHQAVAADATVLTGQQPFRERRWALLAIAQYRSGRQADALASIRAARRALGQELGLDPGRSWSPWSSASSRRTPRSPRTTSPGWPSGPARGRACRRTTTVTRRPSSDEPPTSWPACPSSRSRGCWS